MVWYQNWLEPKKTADDLSLQNTLLIVSKEIRGNDLAVDYIFFNSFANANLENANFKNADLRLADFYSANLTNADLSGADMRGAFLAGADLEGAILDNAILSNTNLKCINHPICNSWMLECTLLLQPFW